MIEPKSERCPWCRRFHSWEKPNYEISNFYATVLRLSGACPYEKNEKEEKKPT